MWKLYPYIFIAILSCAIIVLYIANPAEYFWMPKCPTKIILGIDCPGCGIQRAIHAFLHGHIKEAMGYNLFLAVALPYLIAVLLCSVLRNGRLRQKLQKIVESKWLTQGYVILFFIWFIVRNIFKI